MPGGGNSLFESLRAMLSDGSNTELPLSRLKLCENLVDELLKTHEK